MTEHERRELEPPTTPLKRGASGSKVKQVQEWLTLHGYGTAIDGDFGPATEAALKAFQQKQEDEAEGPGAWEYGEVNEATWRTLVAPLATVIAHRRVPIWPGAENILSAAQVHLAAKPCEVGGPNSGPWVRLYMDGHEGKDWPWCAGFATYVLRQALGHDKRRTFSCDELAAKAQVSGRFKMAGGSVATVRAGDLFIIRRAAQEGATLLRGADWTHCGIVTAVGAEHFETVEGNTNQGGSREGTEVCKRVRAFNNRTDFVLMGDER
jgi:hypothetical protein